MMYVFDPCSCFLLLCILIVNIVLATGSSQPNFGHWIKRVGKRGTKAIKNKIKPHGKPHGQKPMAPCLATCTNSFGKKDHADGDCPKHKRNGGCSNNDFWRKKGFPFHKRCPESCRDEISQLCMTELSRAPTGAAPCIDQPGAEALCAKLAKEKKIDCHDTRFGGWGVRCRKSCGNC